MVLIKAFMPELRYLILGKIRFSDLTPLPNCKEPAFGEKMLIGLSQYMVFVGYTLSLRDRCA